MSDTVRVEMRAYQKVTLGRTCDMDKADWEEYNRILDSDMRYREKELAILELGAKYDLDDVAHQFDWGDMEEVEITLVKEPNQ